MSLMRLPAASLIAFAPFGPRLLCVRLQAREIAKGEYRHWLLTVGQRACGGILERGEGTLEVTLGARCPQRPRSRRRNASRLEPCGHGLALWMGDGSRKQQPGVTKRYIDFMSRSVRESDLRIEGNRVSTLFIVFPSLNSIVNASQ